MNQATEGTRPRRIIFVGDANCGKRELILQWRARSLNFRSQGVTAVFDDITISYEIFINMEKTKSYDMTLVDTTGHEGYQSLRLLTYTDCDCVVACFNSMESLQHCLDVRANSSSSF